MDVDDAVPFEGFLLEQRAATEGVWRPSRFISVAATLEAAHAAVLIYTGQQIELSLVDQGVAVLGHARELGVRDGCVLALM